MRNDELDGFGDQLRAIRSARGFTQEQLAERAGLSAHYIGNLEQGARKPSISAILLLCHALGATPDQLLARSITQQMRDGLPINVEDANTLRDVMSTLCGSLGDLLPVEDEETPMLFGVPFALAQAAPAQGRLTPLFSDRDDTPQDGKAT